MARRVICCVGESQCADCVRRQRVRDYHKANVERLSEHKRQKNAANPGLRLAYHHAWRDRDPDGYRLMLRRRKLKTYGLTLESYDALLASQGGGCALCGKEPKDKNLCVDHDHTCCPGNRSCGQCVRGLLCSVCNRLLGWFDSKKDAILDYVQRRPDPSS